MTEQTSDVPAVEQPHLIVNVSRHYRVRLFPEDQALMLSRGVDLGDPEMVVEWIGSDLVEWFDDEDVDFEWVVP